MHIIFIVLILILLILYFLSQSNSAASSSKLGQTEAIQDISDDLNPIFISDGKLFWRESLTKSTQIESQHVEQMEARQENAKKLAGWKEGTTWDTSFSQMRGMGERQDETSIRFSSVVRSGNDKLTYFLKGAGFGGLFEYCKTTDKELRLMHRQNLDYRDLSKPNSQGFLLASSLDKSGASNLVSIHPHDNTYRELTGGDTLDSAPSWSHSDKPQIVYQSQGLARDPSGYLKGIGPAEIMLLDSDSGELNTVFANDDTDYLKPAISTSGALYFIKRPYEDAGYSNSNVIVDALLFPFRLLRAVFHYLNFFSMMYSRKPLTSAGGPQLDQDIKELVIQGRRIDTEKALRKGWGQNGTPSLVPADWVLVRCDKDGQQQVLATHVASYSLAEDDNIIYSNGCAVFYITPAGEHKKVFQERLIEDILI